MCLIFSVTPAIGRSVILRTPRHIFMIDLFRWARLTGIVSLFPPFAIFVARAILLSPAWSGNLRNLVFPFNHYVTSFESIQDQFVRNVRIPASLSKSMNPPLFVVKLRNTR